MFVDVCVCLHRFSTWSNNGFEQLYDCEAELSSSRTPECVIKAAASSV